MTRKHSQFQMKGCAGGFSRVCFSWCCCASAQEGLALPSAALPGSDPSDLGTPGITVF